jgi:hypothetical protein
MKQLISRGFQIACLGLALMGIESASALETKNPKLSGPYQYKNLTVFLVHGKDNMEGKNYMTLEEAMEMKKVTVHETGEVGELTVENHSTDVEIYIHSGDIVKGGKQDRVLQVDLVLPPNSGRVAIKSFCVEQGRWQKREGESVAQFNGSTDQIVSKEMKMAVRKAADQSEVWANVAKTQGKLSANLKGDVKAAASPSSLQLALENKQVQASTQEYTDKLKLHLEKQKDTIGYVYAVNGELAGAEIYGSNALFNKLLPKLLKSSVTEAIAELDAKKEVKTVEAKTILQFLAEGESAKGTKKEVSPRIQLNVNETDKVYYEETVDKKEKGWIHRSYIQK